MTSPVYIRIGWGHAPALHLRRRWIKCLFAGVLLVVVSVRLAQANDRPTLYRVDTRPPEKIYGLPCSPEEVAEHCSAGSESLRRSVEAAGFHAPGTNRNLSAHVHGDSIHRNDTVNRPREQLTTFVSASDSSLWAHEYALVLLQQVRTVYVYAMDHTPAFRNAATELRR